MSEPSFLRCLNPAQRSLSSKRIVKRRGAGRCGQLRFALEAWPGSWTEVYKREKQSELQIGLIVLKFMTVFLLFLM